MTIRRDERATSFVELMVAIAILVLCIIPIYEFFTQMGETHAVSEDTVYAETLASRILERYTARPYEDLEAMVGQTSTAVIDELFEDDRKDDWYLAIPEYRNSLGISKGKFRGSLKTSRIEDGLLALDVVITWKPSERGANLGNIHSYALMKFVARSDLGVAYTKQEPEL